jgi:hypothetical protein
VDSRWKVSGVDDVTCGSVIYSRLFDGVLEVCKFSVAVGVILE